MVALTSEGGQLSVGGVSGGICRISFWPSAHCVTEPSPAPPQGGPVTQAMATGGARARAEPTLSSRPQASRGSWVDPGPWVASQGPEHQGHRRGHWALHTPPCAARASPSNWIPVQAFPFREGAKHFIYSCKLWLLR